MRARPRRRAAKAEGGGSCDERASQQRLLLLLAPLSPAPPQRSHEHLYERSNAVANGTVIATATGVNNTYSKPGAPIYVVQGTAGAFVGGEWITPQPAWSAFRNAIDYGYAQMTISGGKSLDWQFINTDGKVVDHWRIEK